MSSEVFLLSGSNRGDRRENLIRAVTLIGKTAGEVRQTSLIYETEPWGFVDETPFLNQAITLTTVLSPDELMEELIRIEGMMGRIRFEGGCLTGSPENKYESRIIDLDILFFGRKMIFTEKLMIPHPRLHERKFVLVPLNEIATGFIHPLLRKSVADLLTACRDTHSVRLFSS